MDISSIKGTLVAQLKAKAGLDDAQAKQAADVVENLLKEHGPKLLSGVADKLPDGIADALGASSAARSRRRALSAVAYRKAGAHSRFQRSSRCRSSRSHGWKLGRR
jgi:hypothetical protein